MIVLRKNFEPIIPDNEETFIQHLIGVIESVDELSHLQITKKGKNYIFRIAPSLPKYNNLLISELIEFHNLFGIHLDFSKSIKSSGSLSFKIEI